MSIERVIAGDTLILNSETGQELLRLRESTDGTAACAADSGRQNQQQKLPGCTKNSEEQKRVCQFLWKTAADGPTRI